ncbi:MAG TPA: ABC transporter substrate-binding protein [Micromonosporaceae bacterium]|nr:ABC transporter substrate-binding protein [Micromonosporaceae bacterium]
MRLSKLSAGLAAALIGLSACGGPDGGGDESEEIVIGVIADLTGATADVGKPYNEGMLAYVDNLNAKDGIEGRKIKALSEDYAYQVPTAEEKYKKYVSQGAVAIQGWGTGDSEALRKKVAEDELPFMSASYAEVLTQPGDSPYNFVVAPTYSDQMRIALDQIAELDPKAQVAVFHHDSPFGTAPLADGEAWIKEKGYQLGYQAYPMKTGATDHVGLLQQAKKQGAKYIVVQNVSSPAATVAKDITVQKLDMRMICLNWCSDELFIKTAGRAAEGHMMVQPFAPPSAAKPGHKPVEDYCESKQINLADKGLHYVQGWYTMHVMAEGIRKVLKDGDELTGPNIKKALESMGDVDTGGVIGPVKFSTDSHRGATASGVYQVQSGQMTEVAANVTPKA